MPSQLDEFHVIKATFDPTANTGERTQAAHAVGAFLPDNAIIIGGFIDVISIFTSAGGDAGTIAVKVVGANDIVTAIAISAGGNVWDDGLHGILPGSYAQANGDSDTAILDKARIAASFVKTTAAARITFTVATQNLTAGKCNIYLKYIISE